MAWMRMMGADSVAYHERTVRDRADDHAGAALAYYGSRGETPLGWGGQGRSLLGVDGEVTPDAYRAVFGPGGACLPRTGARLVRTRRPGLELVVSPPKSVALLGVIGRADDMHAICDAERNATLAYLDQVVRASGGRRGEAQVRTPTGGLTWAATRHATTRAGDPQVHDHVLVANVVWMRDERSGWKALDTGFLRDHLHAATAIGRVAAARKAAELGYGIELDFGRSERLGGWQIAGVPAEAMELFSKRTRQIDGLVGESATYAARAWAAYQDRDRKTHESVADLVARWRGELAAAGLNPDRLLEAVREATHGRSHAWGPAGEERLRTIVAETLNLDGPLAEDKVFDRADVIVAVAPRLYGHTLDDLDRAVDAVIADGDCVPLLGVIGAGGQHFATAAVLAQEAYIATIAERLAGQPAPQVDPAGITLAIGAHERGGVALNAGQRAAAETLLSSGAGLDLLVGVAGSGKTTTLGVVRAGFEAAGYTVVGAATSGQAARGLFEGAGIESRTLASLTWQLDHGRLTLTDRHVLILDETGMTTDTDLGRVLIAACQVGAKVIVAGDDRQLGAVGPGGGLAALLARHPERVVRLSENVRQHDPAERAALAELRAGSVERAVAWYAARGRIRSAPTAEEAVGWMVAAWADDVVSGRDTVMLAWRRADVALLNTEARAAYAGLGYLTGPEIEAPGGARYAAGDRVVTLRPGPSGAWVTSERAVVTAVHERDGTIEAATPDGRRLVLERDATAADRLAHAYAITAHRAQGATVDTAHVLDGGGGRELAYVAMSRARMASHVYTTAADPGEAAERIAYSWAAERRQQWAHDRGQPTRPAKRPEQRRSDHLREPLKIAAQERERYRHDLKRLREGTGRWAHTRAGRAARRVTEADAAQQQAAQRAADPALRRRQRRDAEQALAAANDTLAASRVDWKRHGQPHADRLETLITNTTRQFRKIYEAVRVIEAERQQERHRRHQQALRLPGHDRGHGPSLGR